MVIFSRFKRFSSPQSIKTTTASKVAHKLIFLKNKDYNVAVRDNFSYLFEVLFHLTFSKIKFLHKQLEMKVVILSVFVRCSGKDYLLEDMGFLVQREKISENSPTNTSEIISFLKHICERYCKMGWNRDVIGLGFGLSFIYFTFQQFLCIKNPNQTLPAFLTP